MLLLKGTMNGRDVNELIAQLHPLGKFDESIMRSICTFESSPRGYADLYECVLIDTPIGMCIITFVAIYRSLHPISCARSLRYICFMIIIIGKYFQQFLQENAENRLGEASEVRNILEEVQMEIIKNSMLKLWLEDFHCFCQVQCRG